MLTKKELDEVVDSISGTCDDISSTLSYVKEDYSIEEFNQVVDYFDTIELICCEECGWWGYPSNIECDCQDQEE